MFGNVHGLLATGIDDALMDFHMSVCWLLNGIDRRKQTCRYTCFDEHLQLAIDNAKKYKITLQEIITQDGTETYPVLVQGEMLGWKQKATP